MNVENTRTSGGDLRDKEGDTSSHNDTAEVGQPSSTYLNWGDNGEYHFPRKGHPVHESFPASNGIQNFKFIYSRLEHASLFESLSPTWLLDCQEVLQDEVFVHLLVFFVRVVSYSDQALSIPRKLYSVGLSATQFQY